VRYVERGVDWGEEVDEQDMNRHRSLNDAASSARDERDGERHEREAGLHTTYCIYNIMGTKGADEGAKEDYTNVS
jgi:hypothetical protein